MYKCKDICMSLYKCRQHRASHIILDNDAIVYYHILIDYNIYDYLMKCCSRKMICNNYWFQTEKANYGEVSTDPGIYACRCSFRRKGKILVHLYNMGVPHHQHIDEGYYQY